MMMKVMTTELHEIEVDFYKYTCESCNIPIYANYNYLTNCLHCGEQ